MTVSVSAATLSVWTFVIVWVVCRPVCVLLLSWWSNTSNIFLCGQTWQRQAFIPLSVSVQWSKFSVVLISKKFTRIIPVSSQNTVFEIVPADSAFLNIFFFGSIVHHYFTDCHLHSGSKWQMLVLPPMTVCHGVPLIPVLCWCDRSVASSYLAFFCAAFYSLRLLGTGFRISTIFDHCLYCWIGRNRIHQLLSVYPSIYCQALLQWIGGHFIFNHNIISSWYRFFKPPYT